MGVRHRGAGVVDVPIVVFELDARGALRMRVRASGLGAVEVRLDGEVAAELHRAVGEVLEGRASGAELDLDAAEVRLRGAERVRAVRGIEHTPRPRNGERDPHGPRSDA